ncbi:unnamed protein product (macronuclear) [Paramecium tetraurelia]|uniref:Uncharacterized protein n=1 Tax=Paramecium tetraurelia TaxID=5888 RepID=A0BHU5_PARTE|nr:uncharacterized protein GSPATT00029148001 [Paramecium tetraurelia]CAK58112.1 unnamed protein product [Paramecium tetraurelia]|eukprot:XP_001425510.1 hypothetical protein (macronuclear) [Paramecium tetraurelia strain d4-2]
MNINCPLHNKLIIQIDIDVNTPLGERAVCIECPSKSRENISRVLQKFKEINQSGVEEIRSLQNIQILSQKELKKRISNIQELFKKKTSELLQIIENQNNNILINLIEKQNEFQVEEEDQLTLSKLQNIAQTVVLSSNDNMYAASQFSKVIQQTIKSIELINQQLSKEVEQLQVNLKIQLQSLSEYLVTYTKECVIEHTLAKNENFFKTSELCKLQVINQLDQLYDTCVFNDKVLYITNKNEEVTDIYKMEAQGSLKKLQTIRNDVISLGMNQQQLFVRSASNNILIYQTDKSFVLKQIINGTKQDEGWSPCMVSVEKKQFLICAQPTPKIIIYIKDQENETWSEHSVLEDFFWPVQDLSCHQFTMNIVVCTHNKDIFIWKQQVTKPNQLIWVPLCDPIKKAHSDRIYSVSWVKSNQFISGGLEIKNWKQNKNGNFINIQKLDKLHIVGRLCHLSIPNIVIVQEQDNCLEICQIDDKDQLVKQDSIKGNYKILSISQESSSIAVNNLHNQVLQILKFCY